MRLKGYINLALKHYNSRYQVEEFIAYGPKIRGIESYGIKYHKMKTENVRCQGTLKSAGCYDFFVNDPTERYGRKIFIVIFLSCLFSFSIVLIFFLFVFFFRKIIRTTDIAYLQIHIKILMKILMGRENVLLIVVDVDFKNIMYIFRRKHFVLALNDEFDRLLN